MPKPQRNPSGHLTTEYYSIICMWLSKPLSFSACFCQAGITTIGRPPASKENSYALMAAEVKQNSKFGPKIPSKQMKDHFKTYKANEDDQSKGIIKISQTLKIICPCFEQMDVIYGSQPNITPPSVADTHNNSIETITKADEHIDDGGHQRHPGLMHPNQPRESYTLTPITESNPGKNTAARQELGLRFKAQPLNPVQPEFLTYTGPVQ
ncbi:hypothetical protein BY996DRAFT_6545951 [Phakopsora pachyrhizi]|uniref:Uncharacterized protein n=1 Tax=Phakopsora pachyrhizi TaxID=170000 RepID=A0AAV0AI96_PHAPC|nr:hypothetical protein BY996DRAFT_6545951 [Phakopsora pachyrhizi]CAH7666786.1 hypothetical protein PPACK8108_LOCUS1137 [Phakopsora pachyrhizi]